MSVWEEAINLDQLPEGESGCVNIREKQIAIFHFKAGQYYAVQNLCPHKRQMVISRGLTGDVNGEPKVACPLHKKTFSLCSGKQLDGDAKLKLERYETKVEEGKLYVEFK
jgi:nitrite reductase (NADH) small subunit